MKKSGNRFGHKIEFSAKFLKTKSYTFRKWTGKVPVKFGGILSAQKFDYIYCAFDILSEIHFAAHAYYYKIF